MRRVAAGRPIDFGTFAPSLVIADVQHADELEADAEDVPVVSTPS